MRHIRLARADDADGWRDAARALIAASVPPESVSWSVGDEGGDLFAALAPANEAVPADRQPADPQPGFTVPRAFLELMRLAIAHRDPERFALLYTLLWRLRATPRLIEDRADPLVRRLDEMVRAVRRDMHKMRAFVRFREVADGEGNRFVAWFEPDHHIVRLNAGFFVRRFAAMRWSILTPECAIHWDGDTLTEGPGASPADAPGGDPVEAMWHGYYAAIFNPARVKIGAMLKEMPRKYWKNLPETALIPQLIAGAQAREAQMIAAAAPAADAPDRGDPADRNRAWALLKAEAAGCTRCPLHAGAGGTVFGEGPVDARLMLVGEQPGDREDMAGRPFVGPAGQLLDRALGDAGIDRGRLYLTNAVKHFKHVRRGPRRIHDTPGASEITACAWWIEQERLLIRPPVLLALGATAARALLGPGGTIAALRGRAHPLADGAEAWVTVHPSYLLRLPDAEKAQAEYRRFVDDLAQGWARAEALAGGGGGTLQARP